MEDTEYSAYLKKQSYEDLVSISGSIDQEAHAKRYEMVIGEIAERDKHGEKFENKWRRYGILILGVILICRFITDLIWSRTGWMAVTDISLGVICLLAGWASRKKPAKP